MRNHYDVIVIGGGHAGAEAAAAAARIGVSTLLITPDLERIGQMSCNPAMGGVAKGTVIREVDALGGVMGLATDRTRIQFRMLNRSKGPAVWSPRAQCDRALYPAAVRKLLETHENLFFFQGKVGSLVLRGDRVGGVRLESGEEIAATAVVLTTGTFLRGRIHIGGQPSAPAGRAAEPPTILLAEQMERLGLEVARFKTGTPPRIDGRSVDLSKFERQEGESPDYRFSVWEHSELPPQLPCWVGWSGEPLQEIVHRNITRSALYGGEIAGRGPRYCPSIEDKVVKFPDARRHQLFLEPEGVHTTEFYLNGLSTSLPPDVQQEMVRSVPGLEHAEITRYGYAIEYDYFPPHQLHRSLESKAISGLFMAGQINGTTGYEEAGGQGIVAGANAAFAVLDQPPLVLERDEAFIGVLIDDLVTRGTDEPYRLFTSRAEFRLLLRQDNALDRLGATAARRGLLTEAQIRRMEVLHGVQSTIREWLQSTSVRPEQINPVLIAADSSPVRESVKLASLLKRPGVALEMLERAAPFDESGLDPIDLAAARHSVSVEITYAGYLGRERERAETLRRQHAFELPRAFPYLEVESLSIESRQKLDRVRPDTIGQAARIPGVSPSDLQNLVIEVRKRAPVRA